MRSELQVLWLEPGTVDGLDDNAWNKSHRGALDEQKVFPSVLEELDEPELSHDPDGLRHRQQSRPEPRRWRLANVTTWYAYPHTCVLGLGEG